MAEVSKIVRDRLAQTPVAGPHPDADLLTAFAERTLMARERAQVMAHLATCAGCRELVALAAPETVPAQETVVAARPRWLPVLRWGGVCAAVVLFAAVVIMESPRFATPENKSAALERQDQRYKTFATPTPAAPARAAADAAGPATREQQTETAALAKQKKEAQPAEAAKLSEPKGSEGKRDEVAAMDKVAPAPPASAPVMAQSATANGPLKDQKVVSGESAEVASAQPKPAEEGAEAGLANEKVAGMDRRAAVAASKPAAKKAESDHYDFEANNAYVGGARAGAFGGSSGRLQAANLRWTVTSDGRVQRSPDGRNWYYVQIAKDVHFRALTNDGARVWAGGNNAALYYSADAGETWKKQTIERLQGDIIRLVINANTLTITTSSGQTMDVSNEAFGELGPKTNSPR